MGQDDQIVFRHYNKYLGRDTGTQLFHLRSLVN
jgi:hypothetical protein